MANNFSPDELARVHDAVAISLTEGTHPSIVADWTIKVLKSGGVIPDGNGNVVFGDEARAILPTLPDRTVANQVELTRLRREFDAVKGNSDAARCARARIREQIIRANVPVNAGPPRTALVRVDLGNDREHLGFNPRKKSK